MQEFFLHYCLTELLAAKTLRSVYLAHPLRQTQYKVIIKIFDKECTGQNQEDGLAQAKMLTALDHPHIVPILDIALGEGGAPYVISEHRVHGSLRQRLDRLSLEHMDWQEAISIIIQIGQALSYAHSQNVIHGNMKPENIFYNDVGEVQITDFSLAPFVDITKLEYKADLHTTRYMAPEQFMGKTDQQSDQYALACLAYELVIGYTPFKAQSFSSMWGKHATEFPAPLSTYEPKIPMSIDLAILKALAKKPEGRYVDILAFLAALGTGLASHTTGLPLSLVSSTVSNMIRNTPLPVTIIDPDISIYDTDNTPSIETSEDILLVSEPDPLPDLSIMFRDPLTADTTAPVSNAGIFTTNLDESNTNFLTGEMLQADIIETTPIPKLPTPSGLRLHIDGHKHQSSSETGTNIQLPVSTDQATDNLQISLDRTDTDSEAFYVEQPTGIQATMPKEAEIRLNRTDTDSEAFYIEQPTGIQATMPKEAEITLWNNDQIPTSIYAPLPQPRKPQRALRLWIGAASIIIILVGFLLPYFFSHMTDHFIINGGQNNNNQTKNIAYATNTARATTIVLQPAVQPKPTLLATATAIPAVTKVPVVTSTAIVAKNPAVLPTSIQIPPTATAIPHGTGSIQIDAGGSGAGSFVADEDFSDPFPARSSSDSKDSDPIDTSGVNNPAPEIVYQSARVGDSLYTIPNLTPNAPYNVRLHFAENYWTQAGKRTFNVAINGQQVLSNFDIFATAGATGKAVVEQFTITPTNQGTITIQFTTVHNNAEVSAIEILAI